MKNWWTHSLILPNRFFFLLLSQSLSNTESDPLWVLFYDFFFLKCRKYRYKQQILLKAKSNELEFTSSLAGDPVLLCCPSLQFWLLGTLFCLIKVLRFFSFFLRKETARAVLVNSWGDHYALPLTDEFLSVGSPFASEQALHLTWRRCRAFCQCLSDSAVSSECTITTERWMKAIIKKYCYIFLYDHC